MLVHFILDPDIQSMGYQWAVTAPASHPQSYSPIQNLHLWTWHWTRCTQGCVVALGLRSALLKHSAMAESFPVFPLVTNTIPTPSEGWEPLLVVPWCSDTVQAGFRLWCFLVAPVNHQTCAFLRIWGTLIALTFACLSGLATPSLRNVWAFPFYLTSPSSSWSAVWGTVAPGPSALMWMELGHLPVCPSSLPGTQRLLKCSFSEQATLVSWIIPTHISIGDSLIIVSALFPSAAPVALSILHHISQIISFSLFGQ